MSGICRRCSGEQNRCASKLLGACNLFSLLVKIEEPKMMKWKGIVDISRRPNLHLSGIPERGCHLKKLLNILNFIVIQVQPIVIQQETM